MVKNIAGDPPISVVMPVYNASQFLNQAIDSILTQTYTDFEFIIINDGSTDNTDTIINSYTDNRIKYFINPVNLGIVETLNKGIDLARGKYLARMDADDIALPERFEKQYHLMEHNPQIAVCGSHAFNINDSGIKTGNNAFPIADKEIKAQLLFHNTFIHPTTFFKTEVIKKYKYQGDYHYAEDYYLLAQIATEHELANLDEELLLYRVHELNTTSTKSKEMKEAHIKVIDYQISILLNKKADPLFITQLYTLPAHDFTTYSLPIYENILNTLLNANKLNPVYDNRVFHEVLHLYWYKVLYEIGSRNAFFNFLSSPLLSWHALTFKQFRRMFKTSVKSLFN
ncbi:glycosyltransferase [Pedobacter hiemivivus]|uniref:Glycosyltransferase n=1 Tax=Pedobacter hiemivivus TaxID=2530454 RepID=A0A4U1FXU4_9SPHI|nr:glycosyltransferase [Pedobacter hiemivivus]TKC55811.1 glycosyltransferase [Pedobacter hiemivivus]